MAGRTTDAQPFHRADTQQPASPSVACRSCQTLCGWGAFLL
jgi:hypothetical protein